MRIVESQPLVKYITTLNLGISFGRHILMQESEVIHCLTKLKLY